MLHLRDERELDNLGLPPDLLRQAKQQLTRQIPDNGDLAKLSNAELWAKVEDERLNIRRVEKEIAERGRYVTAARYRRGVFLRELKLRCGHGAFEAQCKARKIKSQRVSEDIRFADHFASEAEAGKVPVHRALKMITGDPTANGDDLPQDNGGASTCQWLFDRCNALAVEACGERISLDVAADHWNHKCERYFTEVDDGRRQDWNAKAAWCNPPYSASIIEAFVRKALAVRDQTTSVFLVPWWNYPYMDLCERYGRVHRICSPVSFQRQDGSTFAMNNRYSTTPLVVVVFGPTIQPGNGDPIRNGDTAKHGLDVDDERVGDLLPSTKAAITARAGDTDRHRMCKEADWDQPPLTKWLNKVHHGDCLEVMKSMSENSIDLIVTSPPYNLRNSTGGGMTNGSGSLWNNAALSNGYADGNTDDSPPPCGIFIKSVPAFLYRISLRQILTSGVLQFLPDTVLHHGS